MEITLNLPDPMIRKIRALSILQGGSAGDVENQLVSLLDGVLNTSIAESVGASPTYVASPEPVARFPSIQTPPPFKAAPVYEDQSGISDGLGDEDNFGMETDPEALLSPAGGSKMQGVRAGLQDDEIENDIEVDDPDHEAATVAPKAPEAPAGEAEKLFADMADMPPPSSSYAEDRRSRRKKPLKSKAKVRSATWGEAGR